MERIQLLSVFNFRLKELLNSATLDSTDDHLLDGFCDSVSAILMYGFKGEKTSWFSCKSLWSFISGIFNAEDNDTIVTVLALSDNDLIRVSGTTVP